MRRSMCVVIALASAWLAGDAAAQSHYLLARTNGSFNGQSTSNTNVDHVEHLYQNGVGGVNPSYYAISASTDSASGVMTIDGSWSLGGGAADPIQPPATYHSATRIAEDLDPGNPLGDTVTVRATLVWSGTASMDSPTNVESTNVAAQLRVENCQAYFRWHIYSSGFPAEANPIDCSEPTATGTAGSGAIQVELDYPAIAVDGFTSFHVDAQLAADIDNAVDYGDSGQYSVHGTLFVEILGVDDYAWESPTFLTAPEPEGALLGEVTVAGMLALVWVRRV